MRSEKAFSGLESAIILIAFVVVASVFSYTILGSGFFATQKAEVVTSQSTKEASAVMYPEGGVYGILYDATEGSKSGQLKQVQFSLGIPDTGLPQDLRQNLIIYTQYDNSGHTETAPRHYTFGGNLTDANETTFGVENGKNDPIMMPGDKRMFNLTELNGPVPGGYFTIETKPKNGVGAFIQKDISRGYEGGLIY